MTHPATTDSADFYYVSLLWKLILQVSHLYATRPAYISAPTIRRTDINDYNDIWHDLGSDTNFVEQLPHRIWHVIVHGKWRGQRGFKSKFWEPCPPRNAIASVVTSSVCGSVGWRSWLAVIFSAHATRLQTMQKCHQNEQHYRGKARTTVADTKRWMAYRLT